VKRPGLEAGDGRDVAGDAVEASVPFAQEGAEWLAVGDVEQQLISWVEALLLDRLDHGLLAERLAELAVEHLEQRFEVPVEREDLEPPRTGVCTSMAASARWTRTSCGIFRNLACASTVSSLCTGPIALPVVSSIWTGWEGAIAPAVVLSSSKIVAAICSRSRRCCSARARTRNKGRIALVRIAFSAARSPRSAHRGASS